MTISGNNFKRLPAVRTEKLAYSYEPHGGAKNSTVQVLKELDIKIDTGKVVGILGPNGSGKTTLLKNLILYLKPQGGRIEYFGKPHADIHSRNLSKTLSLVPQRPGGGASLTVYEMIILGRLPHMENRWTGFSEADRAVVDSFIQKLGLQDLKHRKCHALSGGEFQKVLLARALVQESDILLLDEATSNLDPNHSVEIMELVRNFAGGGGTVVAVMHDLNLAARFCDRVVLMKNGKVKHHGTPHDVYTRSVIHDIYGIDSYISCDDVGVPFVLPRKNRTAVLTAGEKAG
jgi:iron complex transport system ATP-binding protein